MKARPGFEMRMIPILLVVISLSLSFGLPRSLFAQRAQTVLGDLIRGTARVSEDVAVRDVERVVKDMAKSRAMREAVDTELREAASSLEKAGKAGALSRAELVMQLLRKSTTNLDPGVFQRLKEIDEGSREAAAGAGPRRRADSADDTRHCHPVATFFKRAASTRSARSARWGRMRRRKPCASTKPFAVVPWLCTRGIEPSVWLISGGR